MILKLVVAHPPVFDRSVAVFICNSQADFYKRLGTCLLFFLGGLRNVVNREAGWYLPLGRGLLRDPAP